MSIVYIRFAARRFAARQRSPLLERLVAGASGSARVLDWRAEALRVIAPVAQRLPSVAAGALSAANLHAPAAAASSAAPSGVWGCIATPVHLSAGMNSVMMPQDGLLELSREEAEALAGDFNRVFAGAGTRLQVARGAILVCVFDQAFEVTTHDPEAVMGRDVFAFQPTGIDAPRLRRQMTEMEMWLFDHAVNRARARNASKPVTGFWLWGGGAMDSVPAVLDIAIALRSAAPSVRAWTAGRDPFFAAFGEQTQFPRGTGPGVVVCVAQPGSEMWPEVEQRWLAPALAALRSGKIRRVDLSAAERRFTVGRAPNLRFWRRPQPWWQSFETADRE